MTQLVADASIVGNVLLADERSALTDKLSALLMSSELVEPAHWPVESCGLVLKAARRDRLSADERDQALGITLDLVAAAEVQAVAYAPAVVALALKHHLTVYDAAYLELSLRLDIPLLTADIALRQVAEREGVILADMA